MIGPSNGWAAPLISTVPAKPRTRFYQPFARRETKHQTSAPRRPIEGWRPIFEGPAGQVGHRGDVTAAIAVGRSPARLVRFLSSGRAKCGDYFVGWLHLGDLMLDCLGLAAQCRVSQSPLRSGSDRLGCEFVGE